MKNANSAAKRNLSHAGKTAKTAPRSLKNSAKPLRKVKTITGLCVVEKRSPELLVLNIIPNSYLMDIILSPGEEIHKVSIKSIGIIK